MSVTKACVMQHAIQIFVCLPDTWSLYKSSKTYDKKQVSVSFTWKHKQDTFSGLYNNA